MSYLLLTGCTGLVGRYLLRDLLRSTDRVAVLVRSTRMASARHRVEAVMSYWEREIGTPLKRPVVLEGNMNEPNLGLGSEQLEWLSQNCDRVLHNAAAMNFRETKDGEPWRTNVEGLKNLVGVCRTAGIRKMHHVSTAYLCGLRTGRVLEDEVNLGQELGNVYEKSKLGAEELIRSEPAFDEFTIYRPGSVVGDSQTGVVWSYHGFYLPLQLAHSVSNIIPPSVMNERFMKLLGLRGDEGKNLVPVDWLSQAITYLVKHPEHHGKCYHLTHPNPVSVKLVQEVIQQAIEQFSPRPPKTSATEEEIQYFEKTYLEHMDVYRSHWRDDPTFDRTHTDAALPHLPCPEITAEVLLRIAAYPVQNNFASKKFEQIQMPLDAEAFVQQVGERFAATAGVAPAGQQVGFEISGAGGGQWHFLVNQGELVGVGQGLGHSPVGNYYLRSETLAALCDGRLSVDQAVNRAMVLIEGNPASGADPVRLLSHIVSQGALGQAV